MTAHWVIGDIDDDACVNDRCVSPLRSRGPEEPRQHVLHERGAPVLAEYVSR